MPITRASHASRANRTLLFKFAFGSIIIEFLFLICVQKTILMKILVLCVINSSRHRQCFVRGFIHSLFVKNPHSLVPRSFGFLTQTTRE